MQSVVGEGSLVGAKENVVIRAGECAVTVMAALGGKIASIRVGEEELLQAPLLPYAPRTCAMPFHDADASGWDECLPSVAACVVDTPAGLASIPDHGDLWRVPWQVLEATEDSATLQAHCFSLPLQLTRSVLLAATDSGWRLQLLYSLTNLAQHRVPWSWAAHPLFAVQPGDRIHLPGSIRSVRIEGSGGNRLGVNGDSVSWPLALTTHGAPVDLSLVAPAHSSIGDKLFAGPLQPADPLDPFVPPHQGSAVLERLGIGLRLTVRFEPSLTPYLGLWLCYGGWPEGEGAKQVCVALEPATAPVDSLAQTGPWTRWLEHGETFNWPMELQLDRMERPGRGHRIHPSSNTPFDGTNGSEP